MLITSVAARLIHTPITHLCGRTCTREGHKHAQLALAMLETLGSPNPLVVRKERWWPDWGSPNLTMLEPRGRVEEYHRREAELVEDWWNWHVCEREGRRERKREKRWCGHECDRRREGVNGKRKEEPTNFGLWHKKEGERKKIKLGH